MSRLCQKLQAMPHITSIRFPLKISAPRCVFLGVIATYDRNCAPRDSRTADDSRGNGPLHKLWTFMKTYWPPGALATCTPPTARAAERMATQIELPTTIHVESAVSSDLAAALVRIGVDKA